MAQIESEGERLSHSARSLIKPSATEVLLYLLIGIILMVVYNYGGIIKRLVGAGYIDSPERLRANFDTLYNSFSSYVSTALGGRLAQIVIWAALGGLVYVGVWTSRNILTSFENDFIADRYVHPSNYSRAGYWGSSLSVKVLLVALVFIFLAFVTFTARVVLPSVATLAGSAFYNFNFPVSIIYIIFSIVGTALLIYITIRLVRIMVNLWHLL
jgi:hypothetical protein